MLQYKIKKIFLEILNIMADNTWNCSIITILLYFLDTFFYYTVSTSNINWGHLELFFFFFHKQCVTFQNEVIESATWTWESS